MLCLHHYKKIYSLLPLLILAACSSSRYDIRDDRPHDTMSMSRKSPMPFHGLNPVVNMGILNPMSSMVIVTM